jgi:hypothetical protein
MSVLTQVPGCTWDDLLNPEEPTRTKAVVSDVEVTPTLIEVNGVMTTPELAKELMSGE